MGLAPLWQGKQNCSKIGGAFSAAVFWGSALVAVGLPEVLAPRILLPVAMMAMAQNPSATAVRVGWVWNRFRFMKISPLLYWYVRSKSSVLAVGSMGPMVGLRGSNSGFDGRLGGFDVLLRVQILLSLGGFVWHFGYFAFGAGLGWERRCRRYLADERG